ncbi:unnamed protein product [Lepidochelys kempii]
MLRNIAEAAGEKIVSLWRALQFCKSQYEVMWSANSRSAIDTHFCSPLKVNQPVQVLELGYLIQ